jgi:hypothetical protein
VRHCDPIHDTRHVSGSTLLSPCIVVYAYYDLSVILLATMSVCCPFIHGFWLPPVVSSNWSMSYSLGWVSTFYLMSSIISQWFFSYNFIVCYLIVRINFCITGVGHLRSPSVCSGVRVTRSLVLYVCFARSLFVLLYFFFWSLCCLFFFDIRILITPLVAGAQHPLYKINSFTHPRHW